MEKYVAALIYVTSIYQIFIYFNNGCPPKQCYVIYWILCNTLDILANVNKINY